MQKVELETAIARKIFLWTMFYAVAFCFAVIVIMRDN
jgi:hypothetical protein